MLKEHAKVIAFIVLAILVMVANHFFGWADWIISGELSVFLQNLVNQNIVLACLAFVALSIIGSVILALPGVVFALAAGALFGPVLGTVLCWLSMSIGACGAFIIGRYFLKDSLKPKLAQSKALNQLLFEGANRNDIFVLAVTRLVPAFPFNLQNFAYGITDIRFAPYAIYSALFILPGTAAYTVGAAGIVDAENRVACLIVAVALFAVSFAAAWLLKKKAGIS